jgi:3-phosphoshikimate 1-carboxyvinyltransferase
MPLPDLIEVHPLTARVSARVTIPGSKSLTNRALILAALGSGKTRLRHALWSEDTQVMIECMRALGFGLEVQPDSSEPSNRHIEVTGLEGIIPRAGTLETPLELFIANAGTAARFLCALACLGHGIYRVHGIERMHQRPQAALFDALRQLGYRVDAPLNKLPAIIHGTGPRAGECIVSIEESSQFASALLLASKVGGWSINVVGENAEESPYVSMTVELMNLAAGGEFPIEPDASSASYFWGANWLLSPASRIEVDHWMEASLQIDARFPDVIRQFPRSISRHDELGDSIMTAIVLAPFAKEPKVFTDLGRLRVQECERVQALKTELTKCGAKVEEERETLTILPGALHGAVIDTYNDHRMAMCFATLALKVPGIKIENPSCVNKTFPNFFQKLAAAPPAGLGARVTDARTGQFLDSAALLPA